MSIALELPDQPEVLALIAALDAYHASLYPPESCHPLGVAELSRPGVLFAVARDEHGRAVGCCALLMRPDYGELKRLYVHPTARGRGLGRALLAFLETRARECRCHDLRLETGISQPAALALYDAAGYQRCGPFGPYRDDPYSVFMAKRLSGRRDA